MNFEKDGYTIIPTIFNTDALNDMASVIDCTEDNQPGFQKKTNDLYAIRRVFEQNPPLKALVFTQKLISLLEEIFGSVSPVVKSIYFDKPPGSNWFVAWHQDLTISVDKRLDLPGFGPWTVKPFQFAVQPPAHILENTYTIRIHLDDTDEQNGALRVIPGSHQFGVMRADSLGDRVHNAVSCAVPAGGVMLMRPLLFHSSGRSTGERRRRVIHIECCAESLPEGLQWAERMEII